MKIKYCTVCCNKFESHYGKEVCSDECFLKRKSEADSIGNERRRTGKTGEPITKICPRCGTEFDGLKRKYCCPECSDAARKQLRVEIFNEYYSNPQNRKHHIAMTSERNKATQICSLNEGH